MVILEKTPITEDTLTELFSGSTLALDMKNDIYSTYRLQPPPHLNGTIRKMNKEAFYQQVEIKIGNKTLVF